MVATLCNMDARCPRGEAHLLCGLRRRLLPPANAGIVRQSASSSSGWHAGCRTAPSPLFAGDRAPLLGTAADSSAAASAAGPSMRPATSSSSPMSLTGDPVAVEQQRDTSALRGEMNDCTPSAARASKIFS